MISIIAVNYNTLPWMKLLVQSVRKFTTVPHEVVIVDNFSSDGSMGWLSRQNDIRVIALNYNAGHGAGLDLALSTVDPIKYRFCIALDIDTHLQRKNWDSDFLNLYAKDGDIKLIAAKGDDVEKGAAANVKAKPIHACFQFFEARFFKAHNLSFKPREGHDVGRKNYFDILGLGYKVKRIPAGYEDVEKKSKFYPGVWGDEYYIQAKPTLYHNWYSSRMYKKDKVDNLTKKEHEKRKKNVFLNEFVEDILSYE